jgi:hypothetical protein
MSDDWVLPDSGKKPFTDYTKWRLKADDSGRHIWHYLESDADLKEWPQSPLDKYWLGLDTVQLSTVFSTLAYWVVSIGFA